MTSYVLPDTMIACGSVPHSWLFKKTKFVIHHCGFGTSAATMIYGIPSIPVPHVLDQLGFAMQLSDINVATKPIKSKDLSEQTIIEAIEEMNHTYDEKKTAGDALLLECKKMKSPESVKIGEYKGFSMELGFDMLERDYILTLRGSMSYSITLGADTLGNLTRIENALERIPELLKKTTIELEETRRQMENAREEVAREYPHEEELHEKSRRLDELNILLSMDKKDAAEIDDSPEVEPDEATYKREERQI